LITRKRVKKKEKRFLYGFSSSLLLSLPEVGSKGKEGKGGTFKKRGGEKKLRFLPSLFLFVSPVMKKKNNHGEKEKGKAATPI